MTAVIVTGSFGVASAVVSYQGDDFSRDYNSKQYLRNCDKESDSTATKGIWDFTGAGGTDGSISDQDGNNDNCASANTGSTIYRHQTCEIPNWWPDTCGNWEAT